jgi:hypothetical protein
MWVRFAARRISEKAISAVMDVITFKGSTQGKAFHVRRTAAYK